MLDGLATLYMTWQPWDLGASTCSQDRSSPWSSHVRRATSNLLAKVA
jgi:hypothetical protein